MRISEINNKLTAILARKSKSLTLYSTERLGGNGKMKEPIETYEVEETVTHVTNEQVGDNPVMTVICRDCGKAFTVSPEEQKWYSARGYEIPGRCFACRKTRRKIRCAYRDGKKKGYELALGTHISTHDNGKFGEKKGTNE